MRHCGRIRQVDFSTICRFNHLLTIAPNTSNFSKVTKIDAAASTRRPPRDSDIRRVFRSRDRRKINAAAIGGYQVSQTNRRRRWSGENTADTVNRERRVGTHAECAGNSGRSVRG